jgi:hypothetical protein
MAHIVIEASPMELGLYREEYDALVAALEADGHEVRLQTPEEFRSGGLAVQVAEISIHVLRDVGAIYSAAQIAAQAKEKLRSRRRKNRAVAVIYLPHGEQHRFEIDPARSRDFDDSD